MISVDSRNDLAAQMLARRLKTDIYVAHEGRPREEALQALAKEF